MMRASPISMSSAPQKTPAPIFMIFNYYCYLWFKNTSVPPVRTGGIGKRADFVGKYPGPGHLNVERCVKI
jgi:hypothetical protein